MALHQVAQSGVAGEDSSGGAPPSDPSQKVKTGHNVANKTDSVMVEENPDAGQKEALASNLKVRK